MNIIEYAKGILFGEDIDSKLVDPSCVTDLSGIHIQADLNQINPGRNQKIIFSDEQIKFPRKSSLHLDDRKGLALHFFANHELLAIEMMAAAILYLPAKNGDQLLIRKGLLSTIRDEQKHFKMYLKRMNDFGVNFGDFSLNDYFWRQMQKIKTFDQYFAVMALTFEAANLDFAKYYSEIFNAYEDHKTAAIMETVYKEEIAHVALGARWLNQWRKDISMWEYYKINLPDLLTPARAKGIVFDDQARISAGLSQDFVDIIKNYKDDFNVTKRKQWEG